MFPTKCDTEVPVTGSDPNRPKDTGVGPLRVFELLSGGNEQRYVPKCNDRVSPALSSRAGDEPREHVLGRQRRRLSGQRNPAASAGAVLLNNCRKSRA